MAVQVTVVSDDLPDVIGAGRGDDHQVAGVIERLHADPVGDNVADSPGKNGTRAEEDEERRKRAQEASPRFGPARGTFHTVPLNRPFMPSH